MDLVSLSPDQVLVKNDSAALREEFDDWALLFDQKTCTTCGLNAVGLFIWKCIDGSRSVQDICRAVTRECPDAPESVYEEVIEFLLTIYEKEFVRVRGAPVSGSDKKDELSPG